MNCLGFEPVNLMESTGNAIEPVLLIITVWGALEVPRA